MKKVILLIAAVVITGAQLVISQAKFNSLEEIKAFKKQLNQEYLNGESGNMNDAFLHRKGTRDFGSAPEDNWANDFGGSGNDYVNDMVTDSEGNFYCIGSFSGEISYNGEVTVSSGKRDACLAKIDNTGNLIWVEKSFPLSGMEASGYGLTIDANEDLYITGYFTGEDMTIGDFTLNGSTESSVFVAKISSEDEVLSAFSYSIEGAGMGLSIAADTEGNIYVAGSRIVTTDFRHQSFLTKFDANGNIVWEHLNDMGFNAIAIAGSNIYIAGTRQSWEDGVFDDDVMLDFPFGYNDAFVAVATLEGDFTWAVMAGHENYGDSYSRSIAIDANDNIFLGGNFRDNIVFGETSIYNDGGFVTKFSASGNPLWMKRAGLNYADFKDLAVDGSNNIYTIASSQTVRYAIASAKIEKFDTDGNQESVIDVENKNILCLNVGPTGNITYGGDQNGLMYAEQINSSEEFVWNYEFDGNSALTWVVTAKTDNKGHVYVYGYASNTTQYHGQNVHKGTFLAKQSGNGEVIWLKEFSHVYAWSTYGSKLALSKDDEFVYVVNDFYEDFELPDESTISAADYGSVFIAKFDAGGNFIWGNKEDFRLENLNLVTDYEGNLILSGTFYNDTIVIGGHELIGNSLEVFIAKYDADGNNLWAIDAGGQYAEYIGVVSVDADNNIYLTGEFDSDTLNIGDYTFTLAEGDGNVLFAKLNPEGSVEFAKAFAGSTLAWGDWYCWATDIVTTPDGYSYIKGWHSDSVYFDDHLLTTHNGYRYGYFNCKVDNAGNIVWVNTIGESYYGFDYNQMDVDESGSLYLGAQARDTLWFGSDFTYIPAGVDLFVAKYDTEGNLSWVKSFESGKGFNKVSSVSAFNSSSIFVGGSYDEYIKIGNEEFNATATHGFLTLMGEDVTKINEVYNSEQFFSIYPNPANNEMNIIAGNLNDALNFQIVNTLGQAVLTGSMNPGVSKKIDVSGLNDGIYFITTEIDGKSIAKKFIIN